MAGGEGGAVRFRRVRVGTLGTGTLYTRSVLWGVEDSQFSGEHPTSYQGRVESGVVGNRGNRNRGGWYGRRVD